MYNIFCFSSFFEWFFSSNHLWNLCYWTAEICCCARSLKQKIMINQKINRELLSKSTTTLATSRFVFQTLVVLKTQRLQFRFKSSVSFLIQYTLTKKEILLPGNTINWERECYDIALCIVNVDMKVLEKNITGILSICILISL